MFYQINNNLNVELFGMYYHFRHILNGFLVFFHHFAFNNDIITTSYLFKNSIKIKKVSFG